MATTSDSKTASTKVAPVGAASVETVVTQPVLTVEEVRTPKKSKRRRRMHKVERGMSKALHRYADALVKGVKRYDELSEKSASKKKDGAVKDYGKNLYKAMKLSMKQSKKAPKSLMKAISSPLSLKKKARRRLEKSMGGMVRLAGF